MADADAPSHLTSTDDNGVQFTPGMAIPFKTMRFSTEAETITVTLRDSVDILEIAAAYQRLLETLDIPFDVTRVGRDD